jgi:putative addiction module antidote
MATRKLFKVGKSLVVEIPGEALAALGISEGDELIIAFDKDLKRILIVKAGEATGVNEKFATQVDDFIDEYRSALEVLANKRDEE